MFCALADKLKSISATGTKKVFFISISLRFVWFSEFVQVGLSLIRRTEALQVAQSAFVSSTVKICVIPMFLNVGLQLFDGLIDLFACHARMSRLRRFLGHRYLGLVWGCRAAFRLCNGAKRDKHKARRKNQFPHEIRIKRPNVGRIRDDQETTLRKESAWALLRETTCLNLSIRSAGMGSDLGGTSFL